MKKIVFAAVAALSLVACGGGIAQSEECKTMIACYDAAGNTTTDWSASYGPSGTCWTTTQVAADACTSTCETANTNNKTVYPDVEECQ